MGEEFDDLLLANAGHAEDFTPPAPDGVARAGVAVVTCMDSRIDPLGMVGRHPGDAKVLRNPGARVTDETLRGLVLAVNLLDVRRVLVVVHTQCAVASATESELADRVRRATGLDASATSFGAIEDQVATLCHDVAEVKAHALIGSAVAVGGFRYDVDTGRLVRLV